MDSDPESTDGHVVLPADFAKHAAATSGLEEPPETLAEWWTALAEQFSESDQTVEIEDMYSDEPRRHEVHVNGRVRYSYCVVDALAAAVMEYQSPVIVRSIDPRTDTPVTFVVSDDSLEVTPREAVISNGGKLDDPEVGADGSFVDWATRENHSIVEEKFCEYTNAFESEDSYERWASDTDGLTTPLPPARVVALIRTLNRDHG